MIDIRDEYLGRPDSVQPKEEVVESLPDLTGKFTNKRHLGRGDNDKAFLVTGEDGETYVALTPLETSRSAWGKTKNKCEKTGRLEQIEGMSPYLVHEVARGTLFLTHEAGSVGSYGHPHEPDKTVVVEYGGKSIEHAPEQIRVKLIRQIWDVVKRLNRNGQVITDFKMEHFTYSGTDEDPQLRIIDYTGINTTNPDPEKRTYRDNPITNTQNFLNLVNAYFPWFNADKNPPDSKNYEDHVAFVDKNLERLFQQERTLRPTQKNIRTFFNDVRSVFKR